MWKVNSFRWFLAFLFVGFSSSYVFAFMQGDNPSDPVLKKILDNQHKPKVAYELLTKALAETSADTTLSKLAKLAFGLGNSYYNSCDYRYAEPFLVTSSIVFKQVKDTISYAWAMQRLAITQKYWGHYRDGIKSVQEAIKVFESKGDKVGLSYSQMVEVYINNAWGHFDRVESRCREALAQHRKLGQKGGEAYCLLALGNFHFEYSRLDSAWHYYNQSLNIFKSIDSSDGVALSKRDIGRYWLKLGDFDKALACFNESLNIHLVNHYRRGICEMESLIGGLYLKLSDYKSAIVHLERGQQVALDIEIAEEVVKNYKQLAFAYDKIGRQDKALSNLNAYITMNDSLFNAEKHFQIMDLQTQYETDKKIQQIALQNVRIEKDTAELGRKNLFIIFLTTGLILLFALSFLVYQLYRTKKNDNILLSKQKLVIEQKNRQITDSISYARRIQNAVLSSEDEFVKLFPDSFILFLPKDIVSGDFFFFRQIGSKCLVAAADCTGHGVPGAFMSMLGTTLMNEIIGKGNPESAAAILETMREKAKDALHQSSFKSETKDGMEMALCLYDRVSKKLQFAGAGSPFYLIRNGNLTQYKGTSCPIGVYVKEHKFENITIDLERGDAIYMFSDGYADQIGGSNTQKLKLKAFKQLLVDNAHIPMVEQKEVLEKFILEYMKGYGQIDDILVMGFRVE
jgi:serine phosphatase RsbU (regulator of sigma subunit)